MVSQEHCMEAELEPPEAQIDALMASADLNAHDIHAQCIDVSAMLFPVARFAPSEEILSAVATRLSSLVKGLFDALCGGPPGENGHAAIWNMVTHAPFLRERPLIDFLMARFAEQQLRERFESSIFDMAGNLPARLLRHQNPEIAAAAHAMFVGASDPGLLHEQLSPELLHRLCWQMVSLIQESGLHDGAGLVANAQNLLAHHDEAMIGRVAAQKLVYFLGREGDFDLLDPALAGLDLFVAAVGTHNALDHDYVLRLLAGRAIAPVAILLRACGVEKMRAMDIITNLGRFDFVPDEINAFDQGYDHMDDARVAKTVSLWATERGLFLSNLDRVST